ncbi:MAG: hypothetical protein WDO13_13720 [Verrucomicrobiota bacterium]
MLAGASAAAPATLLYTGTSATLAQGLTVSNGAVGTVKNGNTGVLTLGGPISTNGGTLNLSQGKIAIASAITGALASSQLNVNGGATVGLTVASSYAGPTSVSGGSTLLTASPGRFRPARPSRSAPVRIPAPTSSTSSARRRPSPRSASPAAAAQPTRSSAATAARPRPASGRRPAPPRAR